MATQLVTGHFGPITVTESATIQTIAHALAGAGLCPIRLEDLEIAATRNALVRYNGNRTQAAASLGISLRTLQRRLRDSASVVDSTRPAERERLKGLCLPDGTDWRDIAASLHGQTGPHYLLINAALNGGLDVENDDEDENLSFIAPPGDGPFGNRVIGEIRGGVNAVLRITVKID